MSLIIFGDTFTFPDGNAATNRVYTFAKGFIENGITAHVICFENGYPDINDGIADGIKYFHPFNQTKRSEYFIVRRWQKLRKYCNTFKLIRDLNKAEKIIGINLWTNRLIIQLFMYFLARYFKIKIIHEHSEHPLRNYQGSFLRKTTGEIRSYLGTKLCDGIYCISQYLIDFYRTRGVAQKKLLLVPSTVDTGRFKNAYNPPLSFHYILYCGSLTIVKDGVHILIESFSKIAANHPEIHLVLIGKGDLPEEELVIRNLVKGLEIHHRIHLLGQLSRTEIPAYLCNAKILALARPKSLVADAGFPSKLTEYLSTGNPIVVTRVGEIPLFLKDQENAFLCDSDSIQAFADSLEFVLSNYEFAKKVGEKGMELTATIFNYNFQARRMIDFIRTL